MADAVLRLVYSLTKHELTSDPGSVSDVLQHAAGFIYANGSDSEPLKSVWGTPNATPAS